MEYVPEHAGEAVSAGIVETREGEGQNSAYSPTNPEGDEKEEPPSSQLKDGVRSARSKSTPSTLSEDLEDQVVSEAEASQRLGRARGTGRKRVAGNSVGSQSRETSEDRQDGKRKPRKSARLG